LSTSWGVAQMTGDLPRGWSKYKRNFKIPLYCWRLLESIVSNTSLLLFWHGKIVLFVDALPRAICSTDHSFIHSVPFMCIFWRVFGALFFKKSRHVFASNPLATYWSYRFETWLSDWVIELRFYCNAWATICSVWCLLFSIHKWMSTDLTSQRRHGNIVPRFYTTDLPLWRVLGRTAVGWEFSWGFPWGLGYLDSHRFFRTYEMGVGLRSNPYGSPGSRKTSSVLGELISSYTS